MRPVIISLAIIVLAGSACYGEESEGQLIVEIAAAVVEIRPRPPGRHLIRIPGITLTMRFSAQCDDALQPDSLSVSVADTRVTIRKEELQNQDAVEKTIRIPRRQIGPVAIEDFCVAGEQEPGKTELRMPNALTAQLSLKCVNAERQSIIYQTKALELSLRCQSPAND